MISPEFAASFLAAQKAVKIAKKDSTNPHFKSKYADLASVWDACREALHENGIAVVQSAAPLYSDGKLEGINMHTNLIHISGQIVTSECAVPARGSGPQDYGGAISYARRYGLSAAVGVIPDDDDDANAVSRKPAPQAQHKAVSAVTEAFVPQDDGAWERRIAGHKSLAACKDDKALILSYCKGDQTHPLFLKLAAKAAGFGK